MGLKSTLHRFDWPLSPSRPLAVGTVVLTAMQDYSYLILEQTSIYASRQDLDFSPNAVRPLSEYISKPATTVIRHMADLEFKTTTTANRRLSYFCSAPTGYKNAESSAALSRLALKSTICNGGRKP